MVSIGLSVTDKDLARVDTRGNAANVVPQPSAMVIRTDRAEKEGELCMTVGQRRRAWAPISPLRRRAFDTAHAILEASGLRYQSRQIEGLAAILTVYAEEEIRRHRESPQTADAEVSDG